MRYKKVFISKRQCLVGEPPIKAIPYKELTPGTNVYQVGVGNHIGGENSSSRLDVFDVPVTYKGIYELAPGFNYLVFEFPKGYTTGWNLFNKEQRVFIIYRDIDNELIQNTPCNSIRIYKTYFKLMANEA